MSQRFARVLILLQAILFVLCASSYVHAQVPVMYPQVETKIDPTSGTVGDRFNLDLVVRVPDSKGLSVLPLFDTQTTWSLVEALPPSPVFKRDGVDVVLYRYVIAPFETGKIELPQVAFSYSTADDATSHTTLSEANWISIDSVLQSGAPTDRALRDVKPPETMPIPAEIIVGGSIILILILAAIGYLLWRRYAASLRRLLSSQLRPDQKALKQLNAIESEKLIEQKKVKEYYTRLADVLRGYLAEAYNVHAPDLTTNELLMNLDELAAQQPNRHSANFRTALAKLTELLDEADLVKFARSMPEASHSRRALQNARDIVTLTKYRLEPDDENTAPAPGRAPLTYSAGNTSGQSGSGGEA